MDYYTRGENAFLKAYGRYDIVIDRGEGVYLYDTNNRQYLDFYSGIGVNSFGTAYPAYVEAMQEQFSRLTHVSNYFYTPQAVEAAEAVKKATGLEGVFFCNSGTEATEGALKLARKYYYLKRGKADSEVISFHHSFHGRSTGSVKLTGNPRYQEAFGPLIEGVHYATLNDIESVKQYINERTAAIIIEPIQGEGGVYPVHKDFMLELRELCTRHDICLILDEVQCGMGRTGTIMTYFQYGIMPDIVCLAKDILEKENMLEHVRDISEYLIEKLDELVSEYDIVETRRGIGLMQGLVLKQEAKPYVSALLDLGVIVVTAGTNVIRMLPPFIIEEKHVDEFIEKLRIVLEK